MLVLGDACEDVYHHGTVSRISPEAPVPVFNLTGTVRLGGMVHNVDANLRAMEVTTALRVPPVYSVKTRYVERRSGQHLLRVDEDVMATPLGHPLDAERFDAVVVSDYGKGAIDYSLLVYLDRLQVPVFVDTKKINLGGLKRSFVKVNEREADALESQPTHLIITKGEDGAVYNGFRAPVPRLPVVDVVGAGDTFLAALAVGYLALGSIEEAMVFANQAACITVRHRGVYAPSLEQILGG